MTISQFRPISVDLADVVEFKSKYRSRETLIMRHAFCSTAVILATIVMAGCAGSHSSPVVPGSSVQNAPRENIAQRNRGLWGYWHCSYDDASGEIVAVPARTAETHLNVVGPLNKSAGIGVKVDKTQSKPSQGLFVVQIDLTHPYPGSPSLAAFDVRGILITTAEFTVGSMHLPGPDDPYLVNPDGYTRWWNPEEFPTPGFLGYTPGNLAKDPQSGTLLNSTISPYMQFADGLYKTGSVSQLALLLPGNENIRGVFRAGKTNTRIYTIQFPVVSGKVNLFFDYAVDASYEAPTGPKIPDDYPSSANAPEAWFLSPSITDNTLFGINGAPAGGGELDLRIECWDWQGWLDGFAGQIGPLVLISPDAVFQTGVVPEFQSFPCGKAVLTAKVTGTPSTIGDIPIWLGVTAPGTSYKQGSQSAPDGPVVAFTKITANVELADCVADKNNDCQSSASIGIVDQKDGILCGALNKSDWYSFNVPVGATAGGHIHLTSYIIAGMTLSLYKGCPGSLVNSDKNPGPDYDIALNKLAEGDYFIEAACTTDGNSPWPYSLTTNITEEGPKCTTDSNNSSGTASDVSLSSVTSETVCLTGDPEDWFKFDVKSPLLAYGTIDLANNGYSNNDIYVYDQTLNAPIFLGDNPGKADEHMDVGLLNPGTYYVRVVAEDTSPLGDRPFKLIMNLNQAESQCDNSDNNNTPGDATAINLGDVVSGTVCYPADPDWFEFDVPAVGVDGSIVLDNLGKSDNDLALFADPPGSPIYESANPGTGNEVIIVPLPGLKSGTYFIRVTASSATSGVDQKYTLTNSLVAKTPGPTDFYVHAFIVRADDGSSPATTVDRVQGDIDWANQFWGKWADGSVTASDISFVDHTAYLSLTTGESNQIFKNYGDNSGVLNVFYVNDTPDMPGAAAYTWMECEYKLEDHTTSFVIVNNYANKASLAHEMGHATGLLADEYMLDYYSCADLVYCDTGPSGVFCRQSDATNGNIMYWPIGEDINSYWASDTDKAMVTPHIDSQVENMMYFNTHFPDAFTAP